MRKNAVFACILAPNILFMKRNVPIFGLIIGILFPLLGVIITYFVKFKGVPFPEYITSLFSNGKLGSMVLSLSALLNIIPFLFYTNKRLDLTARGIMVATLLYFVLFVLIKFVWN
ncbi:MAG: hypothetical protein K0R82_2907 [Flavipsychrobacter sp.]|nr:hypothetical protein [Flavipsychrobacter sp.]